MQLKKKSIYIYITGWSSIALIKLKNSPACLFTDYAADFTFKHFAINCEDACISRSMKQKIGSALQHFQR